MNGQQQEHKQWGEREIKSKNKAPFTLTPAIMWTLEDKVLTEARQLAEKQDMINTEGKMQQVISTW